MSNNLVIVALPAKDEEVNKVSTEKAAHVTLLFLGDNADISEDIVGYVKHAVETSFHPIYLHVRDRGTLGPDDADVLFFDKRSSRELEAFRSLLLKDDNIKKLYDAQEQYPEFTPHLTLGYPTAPAKKTDRPYALEGFSVDRIAVWTEDSEGVEFKPTPYEYSDYDTPMGTTAGWSETVAKGEDIIAHYGKKGMKWGVVHEPDTGGGGGSSSSKSDKKAAKAAAFQSQLAAAQQKSDFLKDPGAKAYSDAAKQLRSEVTPTQARKNLVDNQKKFADKFDPPDKGGLSPTQKKVLIGAGVIGLIGAGYYVNKRMGGGKLPGESWSIASDLRPGAKISPQQFNKLMAKSKNATWGKGFITDKSFARPAFELPAGHTFNRLSTAAETKFATGTYSTHSMEDFHRYVQGFAPEISWSGKSLNHITFKATEAIKVPDLKTTLDAMKSSMEKDPYWAGKVVTPKDALKEYQNLSGGRWDGNIAKGLFDTLTERGYGAIVDEMDAGVIGETPVVLFSKAVTPKVSKTLSQSEIKAMTNSLTELAGRKP